MLLENMFKAATGVAQPKLRVVPQLPAPTLGRTLVIGAGKASAAMAPADFGVGPSYAFVTRKNPLQICAIIRLRAMFYPAKTLH